MKLTIFSDPHVGRYKYGKISDTGNDTRTEDVLANIDYIIDFSIKKKVDAIVVAGDLYHVKHPSDVYKKLLTARFRKILAAGIELFVLVGNHDHGKTSAHNMSELYEIAPQVEGLHIIEEFETFESEECCMCFVPCLNKIDSNIDKEELGKKNLENVRSVAKTAKESTSKYKLFFGHFGTTASKSGNSFDMGTLSDTEKEDIVSINEFDRKVWTKVYLGHIHLPQEINDFVRHIGSSSKVDFGEEHETKGFYYFEDGKDEFIPVKDRAFKTLSVDLSISPREKMEEFCDKVQEMDLTETITRIKVKIHRKDKSLINFDSIENYLKENSWSFVGVTYTEINEEKETTIINSEELDYGKMLTFYLETLDLGKNKDKIEEAGKKVLGEILERAK